MKKFIISALARNRTLRSLSARLAPWSIWHSSHYYSSTGDKTTPLSGQPPTNNHASSEYEASAAKFPYGKSLLVFAGTALGLWGYFRYEQSVAAAKKRQAQADAPASGTYGEAKLGGPFELTSHAEKQFSFPRDLNGRLALIYFGFTQCPDICPEELEKISKIVSRVNEESKAQRKDTDTIVLPIFVTCDPDRDGPKELAEYLQDFHPAFVGLTGSPQEIRQVAKLFRVYYRPARTAGTPKPSASTADTATTGALESAHQSDSRPATKDGKIASEQDYLVDHSIFYYLMDPQGRFLTHFGKDATIDQCVSTIKQHINEL